MPAPQPFTTRAFSFACQIVSLYIALLRIPQFPFGIALIVATKLAPASLVNESLREVDELVAILTKSVQRLRSG